MSGIDSVRRHPARDHSDHSGHRNAETADARRTRHQLAMDGDATHGCVYPQSQTRPESLSDVIALSQTVAAAATHDHRVMAQSRTTLSECRVRRRGRVLGLVPSISRWRWWWNPFDRLSLNPDAGRFNGPFGQREHVSADRSVDDAGIVSVSRTSRSSTWRRRMRCRRSC